MYFVEFDIESEIVSTLQEAGRVPLFLVVVITILILVFVTGCFEIFLDRGNKVGVATLGLIFY